MENTGLLVFNKKEELIGTIDNGTGSDFEPDETGSFYFTEAQWVREINGEESLTLIMPADHEGAENVVNGNKVGFFDQEGIFHLFEFADTDEEHEEEQFKTVYCEHVYYELIDAERIGDIRPQNRSAEYVLQQALTNTNWSVGEVANLGNNSTNFYRENPLSAVQKIVEVWGGQLRWRVETDGQKITGRYVDLLYRVGDERGKAFIYGDNVESIQRNIDDTDVKTALYAYGKGEETEGGGHGRRISIADVEWSLENGDPFDKPLGQEWVGDEEARVIHGRWQNDQWVHKYGDFEDSEEEDPEELIKSAALALEEEAKPRINYRVKATDLEYMTDEFGEKMDHEKTRLGDVCLAINDDFKPAMREQVNIIKDTQYLGEPERREFEMGNFLPLFTDDDRLDQLQREFNDRKKLIDDAKRGPIEDKDFPDIVPNVPEEVEVIGLFQNVLVRWKYEAAIYLSGFEVYASQTSGFAPSPETMIYRGNTNSVMLEGETDNQYYFRLRAINVHGTPSEFTEEFSAQTARIKTPDLMFGSVTKDILDDLSVTAEKLADNSVGSSKILDEAINDAKIAADAVRNIHIENNAVDNDKLDDLAVTAAKLADGSVQRDKILDDAINSAKIAADAVRKIHIENNAVDNDKLDDLAVTAAKLASGSVEESKIKDMAITKAKIAEAAVGTAAIEDLAVTNAKIDNIHAEKITAGTVAAERVAIGSGTSFSSGYDPSEKETPSGAQSKANAAESSAKSHADSAASAAEQNAKDYAVEQVPIRWSTSEDSRDWVILLCSVGSGNSNFATGRLYGKRVSGHANSAVIDIVVNHTNNDLPSGAFRSVGVQSSTDYELVKCEYNGREYVGLRYTGGAMYQVWTQGAFFDGAYASSGGDAMRAVDTDDLSSYETLDNRYDAAEKSSAKIEWPGGSSDGANYAEGRVQLWQYADTVYIDGGNIYANSVTANQMATGTITAASGIIDDAAITEAKIADAAIGNAALQNAIIGKAQLQEAIIEDVHIEDTTISNAKIRSVSADKVEVGELIGHTLRSGTLESSVIKTSRFEALHGDEIFFGDPNSMEGRIDWSGDRMRLQRNNEHYISVDGQGEFRAWANGETYAWFSPIHEDGYTHATMRLGRGILKGLGSGDGLQSRNNNDSGYAPMTASRFNVPFNGDVNFYNGRRIYPSGDDLYIQNNQVEMRMTRSSIRWGIPGTSQTMDLRYFESSHLQLNISNNGVKGLGTTDGIQIRNVGDSVYRPIRASAFNEGSRREFKKNIELYDKEALQHVMETPVYTYEMKDSEEGQRKLGFIYQETPDCLKAGDDSLSHMGLTAFLWKAMQEQTKRIIDLEDYVYGNECA